MRILVIDDDDRLPNRIAEALERVGLRVDMESRRPLDRSVDALMGMNRLSSGDLEKFDIAFVDLELRGLLDGPTNESNYDAGDLQGGSQILPALRLEAPWLPVIGYSQLFDATRNPSAMFAVSIASGFGFDALVPRPWFSNKGDGTRLTGTKWEATFDLARRSRRRALFGVEEPQSGEHPTIYISDSASAALNSDGTGWKEALQSLFWFAGSVTVELIEGGYSGAHVARCVTTTKRGEGDQRGSWIAKLTTQKAKIWTECRAHMGTIRGGLPASRGVSLLWNGVVANENWGAIAYQTACDCVEALSHLLNSGIDTTVLRIAPILREFFAGAALVDRPLDQVLLGSVLHKERVLTTARIARKWGLGQQLISREKGSLSIDIGRSVRVHFCKIHGDLHLRNILLGKIDALIDFAHAREGALVYDLARIIMDILLTHESQLPTIRSLSREDRVIRSLATNLTGADPLLEAGDNGQVFDMCLQLCAAQAHTYSQVCATTKKNLLALLQSASTSS